MSSSTSRQRCEHCKYLQTPTSKCDECCKRLCEDCVGKHKNICDLIRRNVKKSIDTCKVHKCKVVSFCYICSELLCDTCKQGHAEHVTDIYTMTKAVPVLCESIPEIMHVYKQRVSEIDRDIVAINKVVGSSQKHNEAKLDRKYAHMLKLKAVIENAIEMFPQLETYKTNSLVFVILWIGLKSEIENLEDEVRKMNDEAEKVLAKGNETTPRTKTGLKTGDIVSKAKPTAETTNADAINDPKETKQPLSVHKEKKLGTDPDNDTKGQPANDPNKELLDKNKHKSHGQPPMQTRQSSRERNGPEDRTNPCSDTKEKEQENAQKNASHANKMNDEPPKHTHQISSERRDGQQRTTSSSDSKTNEHDKVPKKASPVNTTDDSVDQPPKHTKQLPRERKEVQQRADNGEQHAANVLAATGSQGSTEDTSPDTVSDETQQLLNIPESKERTTPDSKVEEDKSAVRRKGTPDTTVNAKGGDHLKKTLKTPSGHSDKDSLPQSKNEGKDRVVHENGKPPQAMYTQADCTHTNTEQSSRAQKKSDDTLTTDKPFIDTSAPDENISAEQNALNEQNDDETWTMVPNINETGDLDQNDDHREPPAATTNVSTDEHPENNQHLTMGLEENNESSNSASKDKRRERSSDSHEESKPNNIATSADDVSKVTQTPLSKCSKCIEMENSEQEKTKYLLEIEEFKKSYSKLLADYVQEQEKCDELRLQGDAKFKTMERQRLEQRNESENIIKKLQSKIEDLESSELKQKKKMKMLEERVTFAEGCIKGKENKIQIIQSNLRQKEQDFQHQQSNCKKLTDQLKESNRRLKEVREGMDKMSKINKEKDIYFKDIEKMNQQVLVENEKTKAELLEARKMQSRYFTAIQNKNCEAETLLQQYQIYQDEASKAIERENEVSRQLTLANNELSQRSKRLTELENAVKALKSERDDLQTRLSSFAGDKLTAGNPAITDLGDSKRPMKIGEMYGELYDNEWTDAMEITDTVKKHFHGKSSSEIEEIIIHHLHRILTTCYQGCLQTARKQVEDIAAILGLKLPGDKVNETELNKLQGIMTHRSKIAGDFAKQLAAGKAFCDSMLNDWDYQFKNEDVMNELTSSTFYEKCLEICWYMVIQNPVMCLDDEIPPGATMNKDIYREFTKSGDKVVFVVWPALFLHKDGPVLYKGVVQVK